MAGLEDFHLLAGTAKFGTGEAISAKLSTREIQGTLENISGKLGQGLEVLYKNVLLRIFPKLQENTCARVFFVEVQGKRY